MCIVHKISYLMLKPTRSSIHQGLMDGGWDGGWDGEWDGG